jgi:hypothetical protein
LQLRTQRFDDTIEECETKGATLSDKQKHIYFMQNLNSKRMKRTLGNWCNMLTKLSFPNTCAALRAHVITDYASQITQPDRAKVIYGVVSFSGKTESVMHRDKDKCFICDRKGHKMKKC